MPAFPKPTATETDPVAGPNLTTHTALTTTAHGGIVASDDARLTNARTPTAHKTTHATGQSDAIAPSDIGAATAAAAAAAQSTADGAVTLADTKVAKSPAAVQTVQPSATGYKALIVKGFDSATAVFEVQKSDGTVMLSVSPVGSGTPTVKVGVGTFTRNPYLPTYSLPALGVVGGIDAHFPSSTQGEHHVANEWTGNNTLSYQNKHNVGYSALRALDDIGTEKSAFGYGNSGTTSAFAGYAYWETSNFILADGTGNGAGTVVPIRIIQTGQFSGGQSSTSAPQIRMEFDTAGNINLNGVLGGRAFQLGGVNRTVGIGVDAASDRLLRVGAGGGSSVSFASASAAWGAHIQPYNSSTGDLTGIHGEAVSGAATGTPTIVGVNGAATTTGAAVASWVRALSASVPTLGAGGATNAAGLYIFKQKQTGVTNGYGIYQADAGDNNLFSGGVQITNGLGVATGAQMATKLLAVGNGGSSAAGFSTASAVYGVFVNPIQSGAGAITAVRGSMTANGTTGTPTHIGVEGQVTTINTQVPAQARAISAAAPTASTGITSAYGLYIEKQKQTNVTNGYGIWQADSGDANVLNGSLKVGGSIGFYGTAPIAQQTGVAVSAAGIHAALVALGLITA